MDIEYIPGSGKLLLSLAHPCILTSIRFDALANQSLPTPGPGRLAQVFPDVMARSLWSLRFNCREEKPAASALTVRSGISRLRQANRAEAPGQSPVGPTF